MTHLIVGQPAPDFQAPTPSNPRFSFGAAGGRYILLCFTPRDPEVRDAALAAIIANRGHLTDLHRSVFVVLRDRERFAQARDESGLHWFLDEDGAVSRLYGAVGPDGADRPLWVMVDPSLRIAFHGPLEAAEAVFARLRALPPVDDHAGAPLHAPVLIVPRIVEPALCRQLIEVYEAHGGAPSGVMRQIDGRTVGVLDDFKKRRDAPIEDPALREALRARVVRRLLPEIAKAYQFQASRIERYIVACYDAAEGGYFRPHRDNTTPATAHRRFAVSINLNAEEFDGGDLRFPEFGSRTYRPPTGGAVVFSCSLLHEATPVRRGRRFAFLPFLFDEAAEQVRQHAVAAAAHHAPAGSAAPQETNP